MILSSVQQTYRASSEAEEIEATRPMNEFFDPLCWPQTSVLAMLDGTGENAFKRG